ncbi:ankyrin repeat domain-containing protein [Haematococcus lacustris]|uniref:Ankyrin repeat domain-containing protein n=1 Tax=Haematococcus lacustris TaxID=44745 RepID=A0A699ZGQ1_HAELA|nr:ankyrin repeat domain-containing protein [Haematococcus lacustris]
MSQGLRLDMAHVVVLDNFLDEATRAGLMAALSPPGCDPSKGPWPQLWERATADSEKAPRTWGLRVTGVMACGEQVLVLP